MKERLFSLLIGYFFGNFLSAHFIAKANNKDYREIDPETPHRGNPGCANIALNIGLGSGLIVLLLDSLKAILAMASAYYLFFKTIGTISLFWSGFGTILGHDYPFWKKFKGGKGVTVTLIWLLVILPKSIFTILLAGIVTILSGYLNLGAVLFPLFSLIPAFCFCKKEEIVLIILSEIIILIQNRHDISNILQGKITPLRFFQKRKR